jgi:hypothetical protein
MSKFDFKQLAELFQETHEQLGQIAAHTINTSLVVRNWLYGWYIVEFENAGADRAQLYGKSLLQNLSGVLSRHGIKGISPTNLRKFRQFYQSFPTTPEIQQTLSAISQTTAQQKMQQTVSVESLSIKKANNSTDVYPLLAAQRCQYLRFKISALFAFQRRINA